MKRACFLLVLFLFFWGRLFHVPSLYASESEAKKFQIDLYGGFSMLNPADLNTRAEFDQNYERFFTEDRHRGYQSFFGDYYNYSGQINGEFKEIKSALPVAIRFRYYLKPSISVSLGFKYLSKTQDSQVNHQYDVRWINPDGVFFYDESSTATENNPYTLSVKGYVPMVGIHFKVAEIRSIKLEVYMAGGPLFARCGFARQRNSRRSDSYGYWYEQTLSYEIQGKGTGIALETGLHANINIVKTINLFIEGGYSYQRVGEISGPGSSETEFRDLNSIGYSESSSWQGPWAMVQGSYNRNWGNMPYRFPSNEYGTDGFSDFKVDLSGFQIRIGVSFRL